LETINQILLKCTVNST